MQFLANRFVARRTIELCIVFAMLSCTGPTPPADSAAERETTRAPKKVSPEHQRPPSTKVGKPTHRELGTPTNIGTHAKQGIIDPKVPPELIAKMRSEAASKAGMDEQNLKLIRAEAVTWRDGSLGCPEVGMMYTQALESGYWVVFLAAQEEFDFRATDRGHFSRCLSKNKQTPFRQQDL